MIVFKLQNTNAEKDYHGCGKAWAAIKNDKVVALRYMGQFAFDPSKSNMPEWVKVVYDDCRWAGRFGPTTLVKIKKAAIAAGHPEFGPRGGRIKPSVMAYEARSIIFNSEREQFGEYRNSARKELSGLGEVISGMCSCWEFITEY
jgi:hypothetical protein|tara:strand:- start:52 stop:486 length:435 start_codon:yes stop_codon:yes gene_type:complete